MAVGDAMTLPSIIFLAAAVVPIFFGTIRSASVWLTVQAAALAWNVGSPGHASPHAVASVIEILVLRAILAPQVLRRVVRHRAEPDLDLMPSNLFTWAIGIVLIVLAFEYATPVLSDHHGLTTGAVGATVTVSLLLLSTNDSPLAQLVAVLLMENALALFESLLSEPWPLPVHVALSTVYVLTLIVGAWLIGTPDPVPEARHAGERM